MIESSSALPIEPLLPDLIETLGRAGCAVLQAPPGAGKTTRLPLALLTAPWLAGKKILVLEPRRLAARMAARRMAASLGEAVGASVGYRLRLESKVSPTTRIELLTDGLYLRRLQEDPVLTGVGAVLFDEFHERGLDSDLALALTLEARAALNPELRLLAMSATLDVLPIARAMGDAPILTSEGRAFAVETRYLERPYEGRIEAAVAQIVRRALAEERGSLLVFLPGSGEIRRTAELLRAGDLPPEVDLAPLYGELDGAAQDLAVAAPAPGRRKIVLASAIAETSLTIEGIRVVVDSGLARGARYDPRSGMTRLETFRASQATADQRRGRAGRLEPGICYRLWTEADHRAREPFAKPEMLVADLAPLALELAIWGAGEGRDLAFLDPPPPGALAQARDLLTELGALDEKGRVTDHGRAIAKLGLHPRLGHMVLAGAERGIGQLACATAALLSGRDPFRVGAGGATRRDADLRGRIEALWGEGRESGDPAGARLDRNALKEARELARRWQRQIGLDAPTRGDRDDLDRLGEAVALAYPDRVAEARPGGLGLFRLANGRQAVLPPEYPLAKADYLAVADLAQRIEPSRGAQARIFLAAALRADQIEALFAQRIETSDAIAWNPQSEAVEALRRRQLGALVLAERRLAEPDPAQLIAANLEGIRRLGIGALPWTASARGLQARLQFLHRLDPQAWPDRSDAGLTERLEEWLGSRLAGMTRRGHWAGLDLTAALLDGLDWPQRQALDRLAPSHLTVPTGRSVAIDYGSEPPALAVKLQEMFGQRTTPKLADGRAALVIHLLSPAGRPLQVTADLEHFWKTGYPAVRAEMRGRYPRHPWPDDPLTAPPQKGVKKRGS